MTTEKPTIILFQCQYCLASSMDQYWVENELPGNVKLIKVPCSGRIDPMYILNAVQGGADGIMVCGCMPEKCHYKEGNLHARRTLSEFRNFLNLLGYSHERFVFHWMDIDERGVIQPLLSDFEKHLEKIGTLPHLKTRTFSQETF
ncbi:MAG: hydrogenase iron-sulfur subunit [Anaerolineaceae bacterium]|jgi:F420-non-reducing hydrogenase iron-sulfur subunit|nr:MAG: hydrogenase iron-sulfur subunit [Anaerolineaceae bacterium]